jgi:CNT family concentrative nucleoside transporter
VFGKLGVLGSGDTNIGMVFAFQVLPTIVYVAALFGVLYYLGVMQLIVRVLARGMVYLFGASGAESLCIAASIFMGQSEAPLTIRPFLVQADRVGAVHGDRRGDGLGVGRHPVGVRRCSAG